MRTTKIKLKKKTKKWEGRNMKKEEIMEKNKEETEAKRRK
jgi:hypothetical protein